MEPTPEQPSRLLTLPSDPLTHPTIAAAMEVSNTLGPGFLEKVYENALAHELRTRGFTVHSQPPIPVHYKGHQVGEYFPDLLINHELIIELKCAVQLDEAHTAQCLNYLKATHLQTALLLNFHHPRLQWRRIVL